MHVKLFLSEFLVQAIAGEDVKTLDAQKMIEAAASTPGKKSITFEEFKQIIQVSST